MNYTQFLQNKLYERGGGEGGGELDLVLAGTLGLMLKIAMETKNFLALKTQYKSKLEYKEKANQMLELTDVKGEIQKSELLKEYDDKLKASIDNVVSKLPREKRAEMRTGLEEKGQIDKDAYKEKIDNKIDNIKTKLGDVISVKDDEVKELLNKYDLQTEYVSNIWARDKATIDADTIEKWRNETADKKAQLLGGGAGANEEKIAAQLQREKEKVKELVQSKRNKAERAAELAKEEENKLDAKIEKSPEAEKEAITKLKNFQGAMINFKSAVFKVQSLLKESTFIDADTDLLLREFKLWEADEETSDDAKLQKAKEDAKEAGKALNSALAEITVNVLTTANKKLSEKDAKSYIEELKKEKADLIDALDAAEWDAKNVASSNTTKSKWDDNKSAFDDEEDDEEDTEDPKVTAVKKEIAQLKSDLKDAKNAEKPNSNTISFLTGAIEGKEKSLVKIKQKLSQKNENFMKNYTDFLNESNSSLLKLIKDANDLIDQSQKEDWLAIEPDNTWEEAYAFKPIVTKGNFVYIEYNEPYNNNKLYKDRYTLSNEDLIPNIRWVIKALKKGLKNKNK